MLRLPRSLLERLEDSVRQGLSDGDGLVLTHDSMQRIFDPVVDTIIEVGRGKMNLCTEDTWCAEDQEAHRDASCHPAQQQYIHGRPAAVMTGAHVACTDPGLSFWNAT